MGRTISENPKAHRLTLRFTAAELLALREAATASGLSPSDWVRSRSIPRSAIAAIRKAERSGRPNRPVAAIDTALFIELRRQGVNLNQIAHRLNANDLALPSELIGIIADIRVILAQLSKPPRGE